MVDAHDEHRGVVLGGAPMTTCLAPASMANGGPCSGACPVHSQIYSAPTEAQGMSLTSMAVNTGYFLPLTIRAPSSEDLARELAVRAVVLEHIGHILGFMKGSFRPTTSTSSRFGQRGRPDGRCGQSRDADFGVHNGKTPFTNAGTPPRRPFETIAQAFHVIPSLYWYTSILFDI